VAASQPHVQLCQQVLPLLLQSGSCRRRRCLPGRCPWRRATGAARWRAQVDDLVGPGSGLLPGLPCWRPGCWLGLLVAGGLLRCACRRRASQVPWLLRHALLACLLAWRLGCGRLRCCAAGLWCRCGLPPCLPLCRRLAQWLFLLTWLRR
jgi:hypothetical protein